MTFISIFNTFHLLVKELQRKDLSFCQSEIKEELRVDWNPPNTKKIIQWVHDPKSLSKRKQEIDACSCRKLRWVQLSGVRAPWSWRSQTHIRWETRTCWDYRDLSVLFLWGYLIASIATADRVTLPVRMYWSNTDGRSLQFQGFLFSVRYKAGTLILKTDYLYVLSL